MMGGFRDELIERVTAEFDRAEAVAEAMGGPCLTGMPTPEGVADIAIDALQGRVFAADQFEHLEELARAATPGHWKNGGGLVGVYVPGRREWSSVASVDKLPDREGGESEGSANADFIAEVRPEIVKGILLERRVMVAAVRALKPPSGQDGWNYDLDAAPSRWPVDVASKGVAGAEVGIKEGYKDGSFSWCILDAGLADNVRPSWCMRLDATVYAWRARPVPPELGGSPEPGPSPSEATAGDQLIAPKARKRDV